MKKILNLFVAMFCATTAFAQAPATSQMSTSGQSSNNEEARYVLGLVRNGRADLLNKYFDQAPWKIQAEVDSYSDTNRVASVALFCVAVDLGNVDVVKAFVDHGYGPADLCRVQKFTNSKVIISKADAFFQDKSSSSSSTSSQTRKGWFRGRKGEFEGTKDSSTQSSQTDVMSKYTQVWYGEKKAVSTFFANPLDFASGDMFDYLWDQGFRSNNLFTKQALAEAKRLGRMDIWQYIMQNKPELLGTTPSYISQADYQALLKAAQAGPNTLAYEVLEKKLLGQVSTSAQAKRVREKLSQALKDKMASLGGNLQPADTLGYSRMDKAVAKKQSQLKKAEAAAAAKAAAQAAAEAEAEKVRQEREILKKEDYNEYAKQVSKEELAKLGEQIPVLKEWIDRTFDDEFFQNYNLGYLAVRTDSHRAYYVKLKNGQKVDLGYGKYYGVFITKIPTSNACSQTSQGYVLREADGEIRNTKSVGNTYINTFWTSDDYYYGYIIFQSEALDEVMQSRPQVTSEEREAYKAQVKQKLVQNIKDQLASRMMPALREKVGPALPNYIQEKVNEQLASDPTNLLYVIVDSFPGATKAVINGKTYKQEGGKWYVVSLGDNVAYVVCEKDGKIVVDLPYTTGEKKFYIHSAVNTLSLGLVGHLIPATKEELFRDDYSYLRNRYQRKLNEMRD